MKTILFILFILSALSLPAVEFIGHTPACTNWYVQEAQLRLADGSAGTPTDTAVTNKFTSFKIDTHWWVRPDWIVVMGSSTGPGRAVDLWYCSNGIPERICASWQWAGGGQFGFPLLRDKSITTNVNLRFVDRPDPGFVSVSASKSAMKLQGMVEDRLLLRYAAPAPKLAQTFVKPERRKVVAAPMAPGPR